MKLTLSVLAGLMLSSGAALCAPANSLPDLGSNAFASLSSDKEKIIGDLMLKQTRSQLPMVNDPVLEDYLNNLGQGIVAKAEGVHFPFKFYWVNNPEINAFAMLGGNVVSNTGTLAVADSESEFASVLSHEIVHVTQRHIARSVEAQSANGPLTLATVLGSVLLGIINPEAGMAGMMASQGIAQQTAISFTRSNEQEADRIGIQLLASSGYDPYAMPDFFGKLAERTRFVNTQLAFLYTHPLSQARISDSRVRAQQYPKRFIPDSSDFALAKARVIARYQQQPKDALNHFQKELSLPGGNIKANQYGLALTLLDTGHANDADKILTRLREQDPKNLFYLDAYTDVLLATGRGEKALQLLEQEFLLRPNNLVITLNYANAAKQLKSDRLALHLLKNLLYAKPDTYLAYEMLIDVYKSLNDMARYHEARADLYYQLAIYPKAIDELNEALNFVAEQDKLENRRLEAKKKQLQAELSRIKMLN